MRAVRHALDFLRRGAVISSWLVVLVPLLLLPCLLIEPSQPAIGRTAYSISIMGVYWAFEVLPIAVTALLPLVLFPLLGVMPATEVAINYFKDTNVLFFGGLVIAAALEAVRAHERIALSTLLLFGTQPRQLLLGFMLVTAFLSMWMNNTATCAMMIPIAEAVLSSLESSASDSYLPSHAPLRHEVTHHKVHIRRIGTPSRRDEIVRPDGGGSGGSTMHAAHGGDAAGAAPACDDEHAPPTGSVGSDGEGADLSARRGGGASKAVERSLGKGLMLGVAWAANVGGMATLTGTGPNIVLAGGITALFPESPGLSFATWLVFAAPMALICLLVIWWAISATYLPRGRPPYDPAATLFLIQTQRRQLGQISYREMCVLADFALLAVLWITRSPGFIPGWGELFDGYATDATTAVFMATLLFAIPARPPYLLAYLYRVASLSCGRASTAEGGSTARAGAEAAQFHASSEIEMSSDAETPPAAKTILQPGSSPNPASTLEPGSIPDGCSDAELEVVQLRTCDSAGSVSVDAQVGEGSLHGYGPHSTARHTRRAGARPSGDEAPATSRSQHRQPAGAVPKAAEANGALVSWPEIQARVPWGVLLLLGGGFALAEACRSSGLSALLGQQLSSLGALPPTLVLLLLMLLAAGISTFTSNVATTSILLPVIAALAGSMRVHPYYFMVPVTLTTSLAFILPVSTPPNALAFASGRLAVRDMAPLGLVLCLVCLLVVFGFTLAMGDLVFGTGSLPSWADPTANNGTAAPTA